MSLAPWTGKVLAQLALVGLLVNQLLSPSRLPDPAIARIGQMLAVTGGAVHAWHFFILRHRVRDMHDPGVLVVDGGFWRWIRHPM